MSHKLVSLYIGDGEYYTRTDADKVIAEKDKEIAELKKACNDKDDWCLHIIKENRHHKYKRCLAMSEMCNARYDEEDAKVNGHAASWKYISDEMRFWERWHERWQKLAEKFKSNSTAQ